MKGKLYESPLCVCFPTDNRSCLSIGLDNRRVSYQMYPFAVSLCVCPYSIPCAPYISVAIYAVVF